MKKFLENKSLTVGLFILLGFIALQIPLTQIYGTEGKFSFFDSFAPTATAFLGTVPGIFAVIGMRLLDFAVNGASLDKGMVLRIIPVVFGALYFAKSKKLRKFNLIVPVISMIAFNLHPTGREVWYFSLYWLIPIAMYAFKDRFLFAKSLGATFTQHSVGGALWIWFMNLPAETWIMLIPIVAIERFAIAIGMTGSFMVFNNLLNSIKKFMESRNIKLDLEVHKKYLLKK